MRRADGFVIIAPEWAGMVPPGLKNLLLFAGPKEVGHKPAMIVAVSASRGGSYPVNELRTSGYKNSRLVYIPEHVLIHDVNDMLLGATPASDRDAWLRRRIEFADRILLEYAKAIFYDDGDLFVMTQRMSTSTGCWGDAKRWFQGKMAQSGSVDRDSAWLRGRADFES